MVIKGGNQGPMLIPANHAEIIFLPIRGYGKLQMKNNLGCFYTNYQR